MNAQWLRQPKKVGVEQLHAWDILPLYIKHFSMDLRKSQKGSEQKWGPDPPIPPWRRHCERFRKFDKN